MRCHPSDQGGKHEGSAENRGRSRVLTEGDKQLIPLAEAGLISLLDVVLACSVADLRTAPDRGCPPLFDVALAVESSYIKSLA